MEKEINLNGQKVNYNFKVSNRARRLRLSISNSKGFVVTAPRFFPTNLIEKFIFEKANWILGNIKKYNDSSIISLRGNSRRDYLENKEKARELVLNRIKHFNSFYSFPFNRISVKKQKTRWGSCSRQGNLNFNYKIVSLDQRLSDYIIVHELCHLKELNHSKRFWALVEKTIPDYKLIRREFKKIVIY